MLAYLADSMAHLLSAMITMRAVPLRIQPTRPSAIIRPLIPVLRIRRRRRERNTRRRRDRIIIQPEMELLILGLVVLVWPEAVPARHFWNLV